VDVKAGILILLSIKKKAAERNTEAERPAGSSQFHLQYAIIV
jgi:hypothetical protein